MEFYFDERNHCKNFWKKCVEHHGFFRCTDIPQTIRDKSRIISRGSSFRSVLTGSTETNISPASGTAAGLRSRCRNMCGRTLSRDNHSRGEET